MSIFSENYKNWARRAAQEEFERHQQARQRFENYNGFFQQNRARAQRRGPTVDLIENVSLPPFVAYRNTGIVKEGDRMEMMVSPFLMNLFIKYPKLVQCVIPTINNFQIMYERKQYKEIFDILAKAVRMLYFK